MPTIPTTPTRSPLDSLACVNVRCELYGQAGQGNLTVRKVYGADRIRYVRCHRCGSEFSERKQTALWNTKVSEVKAVADWHGQRARALPTKLCCSTGSNH